MSTYKRKEPPCAETSPSPTTSPTPTAAPSSTQSPATAPTASTGETVPGGQSKLYLNSQKSAAYRCSPEGTLQFYLFSGQPEWLTSLYLVEQRAKNNPNNLTPVQWLDWWVSVNLGWAEITQKEFDAMCKKENPAAALTPAAAATAAAPAAAPAETLTTLESAEDASRCRASTSGATAAESSSVQPFPAEAASATQSPSGAAAACSAADGAAPEVAAAAIVPASNAASEIVDAGSELDTPAFDYSGMSARTVDTLHAAERMIREARRDYVIQLAQAVSIAHEELVRNSDGHNQHSEDTFIGWCRFVGLSKTTSYQLLQVNALMEGSTPEEQAALEQASPSLLYAAAKPSAPEELVQAVKSGDITTHKQYQEALARIKTLTEERDQARREKGELAADCNRLGRQAEKALSDKREAEQAAAAAEKQRDAAQQTAQDAQARIRELESRPLEVVGASPEDIAKWRAEGAASVQPSLKKAQTEKTAAENSAKEARRELERLKDAIDDYLSPQQASAQQAYLAANTIRGLFRSWCADALHWQLALEEVAAPLYHVSTEISAAILGGHNIAPTDAGTEEDAEREAIFE